MKKILGVLLVSFGLAALQGCGKDPSPDPNGLREVNVQITAPAGVSLAGATLDTPYSSSGLTGGSGKASVSVNGPALASLVSQGRVLLMGFVATDQARLSSRTTAQALAFYALNGQFLEPTMQSALLDLLAQDDRVLPVAAAVENALRASSPNVSVDNPTIKSALNTLRTALGGQSLRAQSVTPRPEYQQSGLFVRETAPLADAVNVYNNFRRPVFVYVERSSPQVGPVASFALEGARVETPAAAQQLQALAGFAQGDVPRSAVKSEEVALPPVDDQTTTYAVTVVGAGGDVLAPNPDPTKAQKARDLALKTAIERFLAPTLQSALEAGAREGTATDLAPILQGLSAQTLEKIEAGNFEEGVSDAFRELFNSTALPTTVERVLRVFYPGIRSRDGLQNMRARLTRNLSALIGVTASVSLGGNGILSTIRASKRVETFTVLTKRALLRVRPEQGYLGKGGEAILRAELLLPDGQSAEGITYRWTSSGVGAGYAVDGGAERVFPFETANASITYKHRDTLNVVYGTDTLTVEALRTQDGTPTVIARGSASVTVRENVITLSPKSSEIAFSEEQTLTATVNPVPSGTLSYVFVTFGPSTFVGGSQTSIGTANTVRFRQSNDQEGERQTVRVSVVLESAGTQTILGQAEATVSVKPDPGLQNGDFNQNLTFWKVSMPNGGKVGVPTSVPYGCLPSQNGNPYLEMHAWSRMEVYVEQTFRVPPRARTLRMRVWQNLDPLVATISINGTVLEQFSPPQLHKLRDPKDPYSAICTGNSPVMRSYDISGFAGRQVTLRLRASDAPGNNGTVLNFDDIKIE